MDYLVTYITDDGLKHHGILGQKWGVRRYQNEDGTLTAAGKKRYSNVSEYSTAVKRTVSNASDVIKTKYKNSNAPEYYESVKRTVSNASDVVKTKYKNADKKQRALGIAAGVAGAAALAYGIKNPESIKKVGSTIGKGFIKGAEASGKAAGTAALGVLGAYAINKLDSYIATRDNSTDGKKLVNDMLKASGTASIKAITSNKDSSGKSGAKGSKGSTDFKSIMGEPSSHEPAVSNTSPEWAHMMNAINRSSFSDAEKKEIKTMVKEARTKGYDYHQLTQYIKDVGVDMPDA